jgi:hypothetical protein
VTARACALLLVIGAAMACGGSDAEEEAALAIEEGCQPLLAATTRDEISRGSCLLPYPSDFHTVPDEAKTTRMRVTLNAATRLRRASGESVDPHDLDRPDGFSITPTIVATLPSNVVKDGLPNVLDAFAASTATTSPTILLETTTGRLVPHYVERGHHRRSARRSPSADRRPPLRAARGSHALRRRVPRSSRVGRRPRPSARRIRAAPRWTDDA